MSNTSMRGKLVLVTGGAKNVGKAICRRFAEQGAHVILNFFHSLDASKQTADELRALGATVDVIRASVAQQAQVDRMFDEIERRYGRLDVLVNNAASGALLGVDEIGAEHFDRALDTNLKGAFWCARRAAALMARSGGGAIVNVSSVGATLVPANYLVVGTAKAALESLTRYLAVEYAGRDIRVNGASSTLIDGDVAAQFPDPENTKRSSIAATPLKRLARAEDLADLVVFLASDAARWITGQVVVADGGLSLCSEGLSPRAEWAGEGRAEGAGAAAPAAVRPAPSTTRQQTASGGSERPAAPADEAPDGDDIAVVGMGLALPGASDPDAFWRALLDGPELFGNVPPDRWDYRSFYSPDPSAEDKSYQSRSVFIEHFDPCPKVRAELDAGTAPRELTTLWLRHALCQSLDGVALRDADRVAFLVGYTADGSQHLEEGMVLAAARERLNAVLIDAGVDAAERERRVVAIDAVLSARYARGAGDLASFFPHRVGLNAMKGVLPDSAQCMMVDTACSSSLYSIDLGIKALLLGKQDVVACGGAFALAPRGSVLFSKLHGLSRSGEVRPLDRNCDGVLFADGAGVVILKRLARARADGDRILGVLKSFGSSSDGKGKAIYAPNSAGQRIAIDRAYARTATVPADVDWVVAHATGTPAGDLAEFQSLRDAIRRDRPVQVTSNKSLVGHTGWAAGVVSVIQVLLGLRHQMIPPQHRFSEPPPEFDIAGTNLRIPVAPVSWPVRSESARVAAVSGFGFGGTNGHLIVSEYRADLPAGRASGRFKREPLAIVGWSAKFPGLDGDAEVAAWLRGEGRAPDASFGIGYRLPSFARVKMPPAVLRALDRCQLMALDAAHDLREHLGAFWREHADTIGLVMGHMGPTRNAALYASRCYLDDIAAAVRDATRPDERAATESVLAALREATKQLVAPTTENSFPGMMPNVIPARVANYHDLHGMNMTVDAGHASTLAAFEAAERFLCSGELDMAIVGGINGNSAEEVRPAFGLPLAEGIVLFAVTTVRRARAEGLPVLAVVGGGDARAAVEPAAPRDATGRAVTYAGADSAIDVLRAIVAREAGTTLTRDGGGGDHARYALHVACEAADALPAPPPEPQREMPPAHAPAPAVASAEPAGSAVASAAPVAPGTLIPGPLRRTGVAADGEPLGVARYRIEWRDAPWRPAGRSVPFIAPRCVIVTDVPDTLAAQGDTGPGCVVLSTRPFAARRPGWHWIERIDAAALDVVPDDIGHVRVLTSLDAGTLAPGATAPAAPARLSLHDLAFLAIKRCHAALEHNGSVIALLLDALAGDVPHPDAGLFTGLVKALAIEMPAARPVAVLTDARALPDALRDAERESGARHWLPVVALGGGRRRTPRVIADAGELSADERLSLGQESVVVAVGGARGITGELMKTLASHVRPTLYLIGSSALDTIDAELLAMDDETFAKSRPDYIRAQKARHPERPLPEIIRAFERRADARTACMNIDAMRAFCGAHRVTYLRADVLDPDSVKTAIDAILARESRVDLLVNAAGLNRSASVSVKSLDDFVAVRDIKVRGYWNLRRAFGTRQPRLWCNFGSFIGLTGQAGETDYASGNDFLNTQASYHRAALGHDEFTIGWTLWRSVGLGANPVTRAFLEKSGLFTSMRTAEGQHHFMRELGLGERAPMSVHLGEAERRAIETHLPGYFDLDEGARAAVAASHEPDFYLGAELARTGDSVTFERVFDLERDAYLQHHVVNGFPTLPGTFVPEVAAEAALRLVPGLKVVGFADAAFLHFLRVYDAKRPSVKRIHARIASRDGDTVQVRVRISGDVLAPGGQVLVRDKPHFEITVRLADAYAPAPIWYEPAAGAFTPVADPYHFDAAPVRLTGMFVSTTDTGMSDAGKQARFRLNVPGDDPVFSRFVVPSILLDGLARVAALDHVAGDYIPLAAPMSIGRIDIYEAGNDCELSSRHASIALRVTPRAFALEGPASSGNRFVAVRPDGRILMQMRDVTGIVIGYVHRATGAFAARGEIDAQLAARTRSERVPA
ncbi:TPA: SDR family oxidoreductase [Burkholderia territorii]|nr:SDR family oxidoreductase [Burkholderia territorii]HDR8864715.1 SDR family oxidoreductase [Burkholderia territorii]HDR8871059.1 SDR family oxidoreductase [Burkholderia territorii]HDR8875744.1 SDR family oxidoreductase [Burkholderia territorii]HDR8881732.1 SDR family oxidoreductase [Burkholderia territorii]